MQIQGFPAGRLQTNCFLAAADDSTDCVIVDPGENSATGIATLLERTGWTPVAVLVTHGHFDHVANLAQVCDTYDIPAYLHPLDREMITDPVKGVGPSIAQAVAGLTLEEPTDVRLIDHGSILELAGLEFEVLHIPGHSPGSVVFHTAQDGGSVVFGGDVLFKQGVGRTDLPGGSAPALLEGIDKYLMTMADDTLVLPGHGPATTVGEERASNPFLRPGFRQA